VIRSHYGNGFLKQYVRDHLCLRTELATNDVTDAIVWSVPWLAHGGAYHPPFLLRKKTALQHRAALSS
jgi:hypothetical protein